MKGLIVILSLFVSTFSFAEEFPKNEVVLDNSFFRLSSDASDASETRLSLNAIYMYNINPNFQLGAEVYYSKLSSSSTAASELLPTIGFNIGNEYDKSFFINLSAGSNTSSSGSTDNVYKVMFGKRIPLFPNVSWRPSISSYKYEKIINNITVISLLSFSLSF